MQTEFNVNEIMEIIPHRYPFLFIDKIVRISSDFKEVCATKSVTFNESYFRGHFPGKPVMPGVLQIEAIAQAAAFLVLKFDEQAKNYSGLALTGIKKIKFRAPVTPGDQLNINARVLKNKGPHYFISGTATINGKIACEGEFQAIFLDKKGI